MKRAIRVAIPFIVAALVASACGGAGTSGGTKPPITIGSTNFSEQLILGELYGQILEANGYTVTRKFNLGNREIVFPALLARLPGLRLVREGEPRWKAHQFFRTLESLPVAW